MSALSYFRPMFKSILGVCLLALLTGCGRPTYRVTLQSDETFSRGDPVELDGRSIGRVTRVTGSGATRYAEIVITDRAARAAFRSGIERERPGALRLSSSAVNPQAPLLPPGSNIPTRAPLARLTQGSMEVLETAWDTAADYCAAHPAAAGTTALIAAILLFGAIRAAAIRGWFTLGLVLATLAAACTSGHAAIRRADVERQIQLAETELDKADQEAGDAKRFAAAQLQRQAQEAGVRALLRCDRTAPAESVLRGKIDHLGIFVAAETKGEFIRRCTRLSQRRGEIEDAMAALAGDANGEERLIRLFLQQRGRINLQAQRDGAADVSIVVAHLSDLARYPFNLVEGTMAVHWDNVNRCRLEQGRVILPDGTAIPLGPDEVTSAKDMAEADRFAALERSNSDLREKIEQLQQQSAAPTLLPPPTTSAPGAATKPEPVSPTPPATQSTPPQPENLVIVVGVPAKDPAPPPANPPTPAHVQSPAAPATINPPPLASPSSNSKPAHGGRAATARIAFASFAAFLIVAAVVAIFGARRGQPFTLVLADEESHETLSREIAAGEEVLILGRPVAAIDRTDPRSETEPLIDVAWHGPVVRTGPAATVTVDDAPVRSSRRVREGNQISIRRPDGTQTAYRFLTCERRSDTADLGA